MQYDSIFEISRMMRRAVYWFLQRFPDQLDIESMVQRFRPGVARVQEAIAKLVRGGAERRFENDVLQFEAAGLPSTVAKQIAGLTVATQVLEVVRLAEERALDPKELAALHFELGRNLRLNWVRERIEALKVEGHWQALARTHLLEVVAREHRDVLSAVLDAHGDGDLQAALSEWMTSAASRIRRVQSVLDEMQAAGTADFATLSVALREVERLA
jgi:glutamate dehydrogenase